MSSAYDMARLITHASQRRADRVDHADARLHRLHRQPSRRSPSAAPTTCCGRDDVDVRAGKTGFISKAGYCLATLLRLPRGWSPGRGRRSRRAVERRPVHGNAESLQLAVREGVDGLRDEDGCRAATSRRARSQVRRSRTVAPAQLDRPLIRPAAPTSTSESLTLIPT